VSDVIFMPKTPFADLHAGIDFRISIASDHLFFPTITHTPAHLKMDLMMREERTQRCAKQR